MKDQISWIQHALLSHCSASCRDENDLKTAPENLDTFNTCVSFDPGMDLDA